jgi:hypothetical protein
LIAYTCAGCSDQNSLTYSGYTDFDINEYLNPAPVYRPFTRWWWPGNDVDSSRLREEIRVLASSNFGGVEVQPFTTGINPNSTRIDQVYSWDEPSFYRNLTTVMDEAIKQKIQVDLNGGSGWPMGGPFVDPAESILTLAYGDTIISGKGTFSLPVPPAKIDKVKIGKKRNRDYSQLYNKEQTHLHTLIAVYGGEIKEYNGEQILLDKETIEEIPVDSETGLISWTSDQNSDYAIFAIYIRPSDEKPLYIASKSESWVSDVLDTVSIAKTFEHLFGSRTGLDQYYGNPFRAVFLDSKEYITDRHISNDFVPYFLEKRGYDVRPWLITNAIDGYDNAYSFGRDTVPKYVIDENDKRIRYDYNKTISELFSERSCEYTSSWLEERGVLHRSQSYGTRADIIAAAGHTSIPEAEQLSGGGGDGMVKLISSGAHLYNKPVVSQEAFVFAGKTNMTTPQKIKVFSNKAFAAGVNQIVYHGTAYSYKTEDYSEEGWYPWASPYRNLNYSSNINETNSYWKYIGEVNHYISKIQYALRSGRPDVDILVYFPFIDFEASQAIRNPNELVFNGSYTDKEPYYTTTLGGFVQNPTSIQKWFIETWELINQVEAAGFTWDFVNNQSLLDANINRDGNLAIRGNSYKALLVANLPYIEVEVARELENISNAGATILFHGELPATQPGYYNYQENEVEITSIMNKLKATGQQQTYFNSVDSFLENIHSPITFRKRYDFAKLQSRKMKDGTILKYIWNQTEKGQELTLDINETKFNYYCIFPEKDEIIPINESSASILLHPFEAVLVYATNKSINEQLLKERVIPKQLVTTIQKWKVNITGVESDFSHLDNLNQHNEIALAKDAIEYETTFQVDTLPGQKYLIDLGEVFYTAEISINNKPVGHTIWAPHLLDISQYIESGINSVKIKVQPTKRNYYVHEGINGNWFYTPYNRTEPLMPAGLHGPVRIITY